ncbi:DUF378 domain-containing protein [Candidatus Woesearchaeota archaeon]|nr:DUF378 domain-containing protein [Candidatus Woesearchaeota archaeon]
MMERKSLDKLALGLIVAGGLNWGIAGLFSLDILNKVFGGIPALQKLVFVLVGLAAVYTVYATAVNE